MTLCVQIRKYITELCMYNKDKKVQDIISLVFNKNILPSLNINEKSTSALAQSYVYKCNECHFTS